MLGAPFNAEAPAAAAVLIRKCLRFMVFGSERSDFSTCSVGAQKIGNGGCDRLEEFRRRDAIFPASLRLSGKKYFPLFAHLPLQTGKLLRDA
jgi:hypothetical protein